MFAINTKVTIKKYAELSIKRSNHFFVSSFVRCGIESELNLAFF